MDFNDSKRLWDYLQPVLVKEGSGVKYKSAAFSDAHAAKKLGIDETKVARFRRKYFGPLTAKTTVEKDDLLKEIENSLTKVRGGYVYKDGITDETIGEKFGLHFCTVGVARKKKFGIFPRRRDSKSKKASMNAIERQVAELQSTLSTVHQIVSQINHDQTEHTAKVNGFIEGLNASRERKLKSDKFYDFRVGGNPPAESRSESPFKPTDGDV